MRLESSPVVSSRLAGLHARIVRWREDLCGTLVCELPAMGHLATSNGEPTGSERSVMISQRPVMRGPADRSSSFGKAKEM